jgi:hypothetical protein
MKTKDATWIALVIAVAAPSGASAGDGKTLTVVNATRKTIVEVYLSPLACNADYDDALGERVIRSGHSETVDVQSDCGCRYNLRFVFKDKTQVDRFDVDICRSRSYRVINP